MTDSTHHPKFLRTLRLAPAIGDWTTINDRPPTPNRVKIRPVSKAGFDSLPKEQLEVAHYVHYRLAELLTSALSTDLDIKVELHSIKAIQTIYERFSHDMNQDSLVQTTISVGNHGLMTLVLDWQLAEQIIDRLSGGMGQGSGASDFTGIEIGILEFQLEELIALLPMAWRQSMFQTAPLLETSVGHFKGHPKISAREAVVVFEIELSIGGGKTARLYWEYSNQSLRHLLSVYERITSHITPTVSLSEEALVTQNVPIRVILGEAQVTMNDLQTLQVGDVIILNNRIDKPLRLSVGSATDLLIQPGIIDDKLCAQVILWTEKMGSTARITPPISRIAASKSSSSSLKLNPTPYPNDSDFSEMGPLMADHPEESMPPSPLNQLTNQLHHEIGDHTRLSDEETSGLPTIPTPLWATDSDESPPPMDDLDPFAISPEDDPFALGDNDEASLDSDDPFDWDDDETDPFQLDSDRDVGVAQGITPPVYNRTQQLDDDYPAPMQDDHVREMDSAVPTRTQTTLSPSFPATLDDQLDDDDDFSLYKESMQSTSDSQDPFLAWGRSSPSSIERNDSNVVSSSLYDDDDDLFSTKGTPT